MTTVLAISAITLCASGSTQSELTIAERGQSRYRIVIAADAILSERYAAEELQRYVERIAGVRLPIVTDKDARTPHEIVLGDNAALEFGFGKARDTIDFAKLGSDGFVLRTDGTRLLVVGGRPRGTLYGVYALLEEKLGVRWFTPEVESVPKMNRVALPAMDETQVPPLEYREVFWTEMMRDADFAARHRLNGNHYPLTEKHGGRLVVYFPWVHSFDMLVPPELYDEHPEYFPLIGGKRTNGIGGKNYVQRCLSNPDVLRIATDRVRQWIREQPEATVISVSQNDTDNHCECELCKSLDDAEGSPAASLIRFVNAIAEAIERDHPNVRIDTLAYQYTRKPPKTLRPRRNVIVRLCSIECCFAHPLDQCPAAENQRFAEDVRAWQSVAPLLYVWDYTTNFAHYLQPFPNFDCLQANVRFFVRNGVKGLFEQGNYSGHKARFEQRNFSNGELGPLRAYVLAKLLWNPDADVKRHTDEFLHGYYGAAAEPIREYIELLHRPIRKAGHHAHITDPPTAPYLSDEFLTAAEQLFDEAERLADNDDIRLRVQVARLPIWYVKLATKRVPADARTELLTRFLAAARQAGISNISEGKSLDDWAKENGAKE